MCEAHGVIYIRLILSRRICVGCMNVEIVFDDAMEVMRERMETSRIYRWIDIDRQYIIISNIGCYCAWKGGRIMERGC